MLSWSSADPGIQERPFHERPQDILGPLSISCVLRACCAVPWGTRPSAKIPPPLSLGSPTQATTVSSVAHLRAYREDARGLGPTDWPPRCAGPPYRPTTRL